MYSKAVGLGNAANSLALHVLVSSSPKVNFKNCAKEMLGLVLGRKWTLDLPHLHLEYLRHSLHAPRPNFPLDMAPVLRRLEVPAKTW